MIRALLGLAAFWTAMFAGMGMRPEPVALRWTPAMYRPPPVVIEGVCPNGPGAFHCRPQWPPLDEPAGKLKLIWL
jgi:hypothetical protein